MRRIGRAALAALAMAIAAGPQTALAKTGSCDRPVTFGTTISTTGPRAAEARGLQELTIAFAELLNEGGGIAVAACGRKLPVQIVIYDDRGDVATAVRLYRKLVAEDGVDFLLGPDRSETGRAVAPVAAKHAIPTVMAAIADPAVPGRGGGYVWATPMSAGGNEPAGYFDMLSKQAPAPETIFFVTGDGPEPRAVAERAVKRARAAGFAVVDEAIVAPGREDHTALLLRLRLRRPDVVYIAMGDAGSATLIRQMRRLGIKARDVHHAFLSAALLRDAGPALEGVTGSLPWYPGIKGPYARFAEEVFRRAGIDALESPGALSRLAAGLVLVQAIERAGAVDREKVRLALHEGAFDVPGGTVTFDETGYPAESGSFTLQIQDGRPVVVWPPERAAGRYRYSAAAWN